MYPITLQNKAEIKSCPSVCTSIYFFPVAQQPNSDLGRLILQVARSQADTPGSTPLNE